MILLALSRRTATILNSIVPEPDPPGRIEYTTYTVQDVAELIRYYRGLKGISSLLFCPSSQINRYDTPQVYSSLLTS
jgi:hypothetical protein